MREALCNLLSDMSILAGDIVGPGGTSWQDVAGTAMVNAQVLASQLEQARLGNCESFITFPSPAECLGDETE
jgi:hypothetical protein